ncbi:MAG: hypothetical protein ACOVN5_09855 [Aquidulcibacter sp.]
MFDYFYLLRKEQPSKSSTFKDGVLNWNQICYLLVSFAIRLKEAREADAEAANHSKEQQGTVNGSVPTIHSVPRENWCPIDFCKVIEMSGKASRSEIRELKAIFGLTDSPQGLKVYSPPNKWVKLNPGQNAYLKGGVDKKAKRYEKLRLLENKGKTESPLVLVFRAAIRLCEDHVDFAKLVAFASAALKEADQLGERLWKAKKDNDLENEFRSIQFECARIFILSFNNAWCQDESFEQIALRNEAIARTHLSPWCILLTLRKSYGNSAFVSAGNLYRVLRLRQDEVHAGVGRSLLIGDAMFTWRYSSHGPTPRSVSGLYISGFLPREGLNTVYWLNRHFIGSRPQSWACYIGRELGPKVSTDGIALDLPDQQITTFGPDWLQRAPESVPRDQRAYTALLVGQLDPSRQFEPANRAAAWKTVFKRHQAENRLQFGLEALVWTLDDYFSGHLDTTLKDRNGFERDMANYVRNILNLSKVLSRHTLNLEEQTEIVTLFSNIFNKDNASNDSNPSLGQNIQFQISTTIGQITTDADSVDKLFAFSRDRNDLKTIS